MFRPGNLGHIGRLGLVAASQPSLITQALAILAKYGRSANLYLPGVGAISGITAGNWLDNIGTTAATVGNHVGLVLGSTGVVSSETLTDPVFDDASKWTLQSGWQVSSGNAVATNSPLTANILPAASGFQVTEVGATYLVEVVVTAVSAGAIQPIIWNGATNVASRPEISTAGVYRFYYVANNNQCRPYITSRSSGAGASALVASMSQRLVTGSSITQETAVNRPILRQLAGGVYAWDFVSSDSFTSTMAPGNAGFFCSGANITDSGVVRTLLGAGAGSDASSGVWLARAASNALTLQVGNGTTRNSVSAAYPVATNAVASAGWDSSAMFVGINNTETSNAKTVNCTSSNTINVGVLTGTTNPMLGTIGAIIIMPTVLPTATERATLRQFIASLSGVTL